MLEKFKSSKAYRVINGIATSAIIGLAMSLLFFGYEVYLEQDQEKQNNEHFMQTVKQLDEVRQSLSTRYLGAFPNYLTHINRVFENLQPQDTVIVFEDVLYYGIKSRPAEFCRMNQLLVNHARQGGIVTIAYYANHPKGKENMTSMIFHRMMIDSRIAPAYVPKMREEKMQKMREYKPDGKLSRTQIDSIVTEKYFALSQQEDSKAKKKDLQKFLDTDLAKHLGFSNEQEIDTSLYRICQQLDSIKHHYLGHGKRLADIHFADYENMYSEQTDCLVAFYQQQGIELIPLEEYLTMSCWLVKRAEDYRATEAILAFPSKYSSDEIGFYSQDVSFTDYISMILAGVRGEI